MTASVLTAGIQIPADPRAPIRFDFELHALRMAFVEPANVHRRSPPPTTPWTHSFSALVGRAAHRGLTHPPPTSMDSARIAREGWICHPQVGSWPELPGD